MRKKIDPKKEMVSLRDNSLDREHRTLIFYASMNGDVSFVKDMIARGGNVNTFDKNLETPLHFAVRGHQIEIAKLLRDAGANLEAQDLDGNTPLWRAVFESRGRPEMIKLLISLGSDINKKNKHDVSPKDLASTIGNYNLKNFLR